MTFDKSSKADTPGEIIRAIEVLCTSINLSNKAREELARHHADQARRRDTKLEPFLREGA